MTDRGPGFLGLVVVMGVVGMAAVRMQPDYYASDLQQVMEQFHLPDDVEVLDIQGHWGRGGGHITASVQFTPEQYSAFEQGMGSWSFVPLEHEGVTAGPKTESNWDRWWDGGSAFLVDLDHSPHAERTRRIERSLRDEPSMFLRWAGKVRTEGKRTKTFCWAYAEQEGEMAVRPCKAYPPTSFRPPIYVQATLDVDLRQLHVRID